MQKSKIFEVYEESRGKRRTLFTKALVPGSAYGENIRKLNGETYREWDATRSKLAAAILKGVPNVFLRNGHKVLYLGASTGTTVSHVSDIVGKQGFIFALDFAPRVVRELVFLCEERPNIAPLLEDAHHPENYRDRVSDVDIVYQDIAQKDQVDIFVKNIDMYMKKNGAALLCVKSRSIDVTKKPKHIFNMVRSQLENKLKIIDSRDLGPFEKDHMIFICKR